MMKAIEEIKDILQILMKDLIKIRSKDLTNFQCLRPLNPQSILSKINQEILSFAIRLLVLLNRKRILKMKINLWVKEETSQNILEMDPH